MVAVLQRQTASFITTHTYSVKAAEVQMSSIDVAHHVGDYIADYSELSPEDIAKPIPEMDALLARSKVVSVKRGL